MKYKYPTSSTGAGSIMVCEPYFRIKVLRTILNWILFFLFAFMFLFCATHEATPIRGVSMQPTINENYNELDGRDCYDIAFTHHTKLISRGDIIILKFGGYEKNNNVEANENTRIIKRAIAISGDTIQILFDYEKQKLNVWVKPKGQTGNITDDRFLLKENYILKDQSASNLAKPINEQKDDYNSYKCAQTFQSKTQKNGALNWTEGYILNKDGSITLKDGYVFVLGDNRAVSFDSSELGPFSWDRIIGVVDVVEPNGTFINKLFRWLGVRSSS